MPHSSVSPHYQGELGGRYSQWQIGLARDMGAISAQHFRRFVNPEDTVLDFGCGGGFTLLALPCARRLGIDPSEDALKVSRGNGIEAYASITDVPPATVDVVIINHALEHTTRPLDDLRSLRGVLKTTGRIVIVTPIDDWRSQLHYDPGDLSHHLYTWTPLLLGNLLAEAGFRLERIRVLAHAWPPGFRILRQLPAPVFDIVCNAWAVLRRRRQIHAVAVLAT